MDTVNTLDNVSRDTVRKWPDYAYDFLDSIDVGVMITSSSFNEIFYINHFFNKFPDDCPKKILQHLKLNHLNRIDIRTQQSLTCKSNLILGFSSYIIDSERHFVLCSPISMRRYINNHSHTSQFFDRLATFIAEIIHEIGNPLSTVITSLEVLKDNQFEWSQEKRTEYIDITLNELQRLSRYLQKIRDVSKPVESINQMISPYERIEALHKRFRERLGRSGITFRNEINREIRLSADPDLFEQIFLNLIINSLDLLPTLGEISISSPIQISGFVTLLFENNGPSIPEELVQKIFTPFFTTKENGAGIGLFTCMKLMTRMGGTIRSIPELTRGAQFELVFPA